MDECKPLRKGSSNLPDDASPFAIHPQVPWLRVFKAGAYTRSHFSSS